MGDKLNRDEKEITQRDNAMPKKAGQTNAKQEKPKAKGYEKFWDMPFGGTSEEKHIPKGFAVFAVAVAGAIFKPPFRFKVEGLENLGRLVGKTGVVVTSNHTSFLDVIFMYLSIRPVAWPRIIARDSLFEGKPRFAGWALSRVGVFPVKRDSADRTAIKRAAKFLKNKEVICIMPEGTRRGKSGKTPELHAGAALIARMGKAPLLPMTIRNAELVKTKGSRIHFPKVSAEFGNPVFVSDFDFLPKRQRLDGCIWYVMRESFALSRKCRPEEVDMAELFPDAEDFSKAFEEHPIPRLSSDDVLALLKG